MDNFYLKKSIGALHDTKNETKRKLLILVFVYQAKKKKKVFVSVYTPAGVDFYQDPQFPTSNLKWIPV